MPRSTPPTKAELSQLAKSYVRGMSIRALASEHGWSYGATHAKLLLAQQHGLMTIRTRGTRRVRAVDTK